jgi:hypothetical protein
VRKKGKLPWKTVGQEYDLEYGTDTVEIHQDAVAKGESVLLVDDLIATGGTAEAAIKLIEKVGGTVVGYSRDTKVAESRGYDSAPRPPLGRERGRECAMKVNGRHFRTIWVGEDGWSVEVIDQTKLPFVFVTKRITTSGEAAEAIKTMVVRGAPLIGATAAYGICLALRADASDEALERAYHTLLKTRPTAVNLTWALNEMMAAVRNRPRSERVAAAYARAAKLCDDDVATNEAIGRHGLKLIETIAERKQRRSRQSAHALQRRLARLRRLGHGARAHLHGA